MNEYEFVAQSIGRINKRFTEKCIKIIIGDDSGKRAFILEHLVKIWADMDIQQTVCQMTVFWQIRRDQLSGFGDMLPFVIKVFILVDLQACVGIGK